MKTMKKIRETVHPWQPSEDYAQYLFRTNQESGFDSWLKFMGEKNNNKKIAKPLLLINGGLN